MRQKTIKIIASLLVAVILYSTMGTVMSYAVDALMTDSQLENQGTATGNANVEVDVYYEGEKHSSTMDITKTDAKLYLKVSVKNSGYLDNAVINLNDCNFNIANDANNDGKIQAIDIENKKIVLERILAGNEVEIVLNITAKRDGKEENFDKYNTINMTGTYTNEKAKEIEVNKEIVIHTIWHGEPEINLSQDITKYMPFSAGEENGLLVQTKINNSVVNDLLPIKETNIETMAPTIAEELPKQVIVYAKSTAATNGDFEALNFSNNNYTYDTTTGKLTINVSNSANSEGNFYWTANQQDEYIVNYIYSENVYTAVQDTAVKIDTNTKLKCRLYNDVETEKTKTINSEVECEEPFSSQDLNIKLDENIQKGYMYTNKVTSEENKKETNYNVKYTFDVNYINLQNALLISEKSNTFVTGSNVEKTADVFSKSVTVNKEQAKNILGDNGTIDIISNGVTIGTISMQNEANEEGNLVAKLSGTVGVIEMKTSTPVNEGQLSVIVNKSINKDLTYSTDEISSFVNIKNTANITSILGDSQSSSTNISGVAALVEPTSKATISMNNNNLSTVQLNKNVEIKVELDTNSVDDKLYSKPTITIELPSYISGITIKDASLIHSEELQIEDPTIVDGENCKYIQIQAKGTQTSYNDDVTNCITILIYADIDVSGVTETTSANMIMTYTNNNDICGENTELINHQASTIVNFVAPITDTIQKEEAAVMALNVNELDNTNDVATINELTGNIEVTTKVIAANKVLSETDEVYEGQTIEYQIIIENKSSADISNLKVTAKNTNANYYDLKETEGWHQNLEGQTIFTYYDEITDWEQKEFDVIEKLAAGQKTTLSYQIIVKEVEGEDNQTQGTVTITADEIASQEIQTISNKIRQAEIKILNRCTLYEEDPDIYGKTSLPIAITIENLSGQELNNIELNSYLSDGLETDSKGVYGDTTEDNGYELVSIENNIVKLKVDKLEANENKKILIYAWAKEEPDNTEISMITTATTENNNIYTSNKLIRSIKQNISAITASQVANYSNNAIVEDGANVIYTTTIKNTGTNIANAIFREAIPEGLILNAVYLVKDGEKTDITETAKVVTNKVEVFYSMQLDANEQAQIILDTVVDKILTSNNTIESYATVEYNAKTMETEKITLKIKSDTEKPGENPGETPGENPAEEEKLYNISGNAWLDGNGNGCDDPREEKIADIDVMLLNIEKGELLKDAEGKDIIVTTNSLGEYRFTNIPVGKYLAIFRYDSDKYEPTEYQKTGISESDNSNVIEKEAIIYGETVIVGVTDTINVLSSDITNINIGLRIKEKFDLKLEKTITKITVQNDEGTKQYDIKDKNIAKVEIAAKYFENSTIIVDYKIKVTNEGNVDGYAKDIIDYIPTGMKFNSEINSDWYESSDGYIHTNKLEEELIKVGETKELTITLIKTTKQQGAETIANDAEIGESRSVNLNEDFDSIAANKNIEEDDMSTAKLVISIKTGAAQICIGAIIIALVIFGTVIIIKKKGGK